MVFHEHQPRFGEWDIRYEFAAGSGTAGQSGGSTQRGRGPSAPPLAASLQLPPAIQADRYLRQAEQAVRSGDAAGARAAMERLEALEREHGLEPEGEDHYRYAQAWEAAGEPQRAMDSAVRYLQLRGREAEHYTEALDLMNRAESGKEGPEPRGAGGGAGVPAGGEGAELRGTAERHRRRRPGCGERWRCVRGNLLVLLEALPYRVEEVEIKLERPVLVDHNLRGGFFEFAPSNSARELLSVHAPVPVVLGG